MNNYQLFAPAFITGRGSIEFFASLGKKRIGIIRGGRSYNDEVKTKIENAAASTGADVMYLAQIRNEPYIEDIFTCIDKVNEFQPDMILAVGGGSVLDSAKAIHLFYENPDLTFAEATIPYKLPKLGKKAIHISVPTTSGTGSETTSAAVFIDSVSKTKKLLLDNTLIPHYAVLDADLTDSLPVPLTISTALDALTHAVESSTALNSTSMTRAYSIEAALDILESLPVAVSKFTTVEEKKQAKESLHIAASMAGVAITNSCTGIVHSYDHPGPAFSISHGNICGLMLPYSLKYVGPHSSYSKIARRLGYKGTDSELLLALQNYLFDFIKSFDLPLTFKEMKINESEYLEGAEKWADISLSAFATQVSPASMTYEKGIAFYKECFWGTDR
ncbi:iron-containing alcohol dehydrogenase [Mediterraneibacter sp. NSJ-55]|uniref:Iron-containing alcohol dehydrogenase n=1 Tax=Mediterraneibacter hominis TaxID=2763054 RepID=A0A923RSA9_9FIRM|nr:iron-containing alcohol dehydrogenase [Mediterraneibacter hominis]MBC5689162.1 iron-containing alcohol dehydrogenase [Mediterraneibacter hominis]